MQTKSVMSYTPFRDLFFSGVTLTFTAQTGQVDIKYQLDSSLRNVTKGLLGNFNGVQEDDLIPRGDTLSLNTDTATLRQIHYEFGETCRFTFLLN